MLTAKLLGHVILISSDHCHILLAFYPFRHDLLQLPLVLVVFPLEHGVGLQKLIFLENVDWWGTVACSLSSAISGYKHLLRSHLDGTCDTITHF